MPLPGKREAELAQIITEEGLNAEQTRAFMESAFRDGAVPSFGTAITRVLAPVSRFSKNNVHAAHKHTVLEKLGAFFERCIGIS